jgi:hypothetical protein
MDVATMESLLDEALSGNGSIPNGQPTLAPSGTWLIPFQHYRLGVLQASFRDREIRSASDRDRAVQELTHRIGWAITAAQ